MITTRTAVSLVLAACTGIASAETGTADHNSTYSAAPSRTDYAYKPEQGHASGHWGYTGSTGPEFWGDLSPGYKECKTGTAQSPIDFSRVFSAGRHEFNLDYQATRLTIENNGHTVQVSYPEGSYFRIGDQTFQLLQFHFHAPSEHTEKGNFHAMEIHFVHKSKEGQLGVIGVFVDEGAENLALSEIWDHLPNSKADKKTFDKEIINARDLIPSNSSYYRYMGSLTTPPCSEGVNWFVLQQPIQASKAQIDQFRAFMKGNNRPTQPVNNRLIMNLE